MIIRAPWLAGSVGRRSDALAEIVDLYKTLAELAGVPLPIDNSHPVMGNR
jgi:arylsulfatase A-like enzyme